MIEDELQKLELAEAEWKRLERSEAGQMIRAAWMASLPILSVVAKEGAAALFGALAERIARK